MTARTFLLGFALIASAESAPAAEPDALEKAIKPLADAHKGKLAVAVKNLATGEHFEIDADEVMQTASLIKLAVLVEAYRQADAKAVDLDKKLTLTKDEKVPGSGILTQHFSEGATFPLRDALRLMIAFSDNTATNLALDAVGIANVNVNAAMRKFGFPETRINAKVFKGSTTSVDPERTKKYSLGSTTANETLKLLELIHTEKAASAEACREMLGHLRASEDKEMLPRFLPAGIGIAQKTGSTNKVRTAAGIISIPDPKDKKKKVPIVLCVLTNENGDERWTIDNAAQVTIARIAKAVYDRYASDK